MSASPQIEKIQLHRSIERTLREAKADLGGIIQTVRHSLLILDEDFRIIAANRAFYRTFNTDADKIEGCLFFESLSGVWNLPSLRDQFGQMIKSKTKIEDFELNEIFPGIGNRTILLNASHIQANGNGGAESFLIVPHILVAIEDITERKELEKLQSDFRQGLEKLVEERTAELQAFNHMATHDLRAPLCRIRQFADLVLEECERRLLTDKARSHLNYIAKGAEQMSSLLNDMLRFSQAGHVELKFEPIDLNKLIEEVKKGLITSEKQNAIKWNVGLLPKVSGDYNFLFLAFQNLLANAIKFTSHKEHPEIEVGVTETNAKEVTFFVRDNGIGFDSKYAEMIFMPFKRLHAESEYPGTGLGLAIVRKIIERHHGSVWAQAQPNIGSTFYLKIPIEKNIGGCEI